MNNGIRVKMQAGTMHQENGTAWGIVCFVFTLKMHYYLSGHFSYSNTISSLIIMYFYSGKLYKAYTELLDTKPLACRI